MWTRVNFCVIIQKMFFKKILNRYIIEIWRFIKWRFFFPYSLSYLSPLDFLSYLSLPSLFYLYLIPLTAFCLLSLIHIIYIFFFFSKSIFLCVFIQFVAHLNNFGNLPIKFSISKHRFWFIMFLHQVTDLNHWVTEAFTKLTI